MTRTSDQAFYASDAPSPATSTTLNGQIPLDGQRATGTNTGSRFLNPVGFTDGTQGADCDFSTAKFNLNHDGRYSIEIRDHKMYLTTGDAAPQPQPLPPMEPQDFHPANLNLQRSRDADFYNNQDGDWSSNSWGPPPFARHYRPRPEYENGGNLASGLLGFGIGLLFGGGRHHHGFYGGNFAGNYGPQGDYGRYLSGNANQDMYVNNGNNWGQQNSWRPQYFRQASYAPAYMPGNYTNNYDNYDNVNPQYTSGDYPGTFYS